MNINKREIKKYTLHIRNLQIMCFKAIYNMFILKSLKFLRTAILESLRSHFAKIAHKLANQNIFKLNLRRNSFKMMYNMSMLRHRFSNER